MDEAQLEKADASFYAINRGGNITYNGPGQVVAYPIFDLDHFFTDIHKYMRFLEEAVILSLADFGIKGERSGGLTGVWIEPNTSRALKICALGVKCSRWVTMHGIGFNVDSDLSYFSNIIPCGIQDKSVTSLQQVLVLLLIFAFLYLVQLYSHLFLHNLKIIPKELDLKQGKLYFSLYVIFIQPIIFFIHGLIFIKYIKFMIL